MRSVLNDISMSELMSMRTEHGMSNQEIADAVGCSYQTIRKLLGKQPKGIRSERIERTAPSVTAPECVSAPVKEEFYPASLVLAERSLVLQGEFGRYAIDTYAKTVNIDIPEHGSFTVPLGSLVTFHNELGAILRNHEKTSFCAEAW